MEIIKILKNLHTATATYLIIIKKNIVPFYFEKKITINNII